MPFFFHAHMCHRNLTVSRQSCLPLYAERLNLTMRVNMWRFPQLTTAFLEKIENHAFSVALHYMHYNFCRVHKMLRVTPAMAVGVTDKPWTIADMVAVLEAGK
jgi:hypothetical protein